MRLGEAALSPRENLVDQLGDEHRPVDRVGLESRVEARAASGHQARLLGAVAAARLGTVAHPDGVEGAADDLVAHPGEVLHPATTDEHDRVLLEVVADAWDVGRHLDPARQADSGDLAKRRVRLLRRRRVDARADAAALRRSLQGGRLRLRPLRLPSFTDELGDRGHAFPLKKTTGVARRRRRAPASFDILRFFWELRHGGSGLIRCGECA